MLKKYATKQFKISQSVLLIRGLVIVHLLAVLVVSLTPFPPIYKAITTLLVFVSLLVYLKQETESKGFTLQYSADFGWKISFSNHHFDSVEILPSTMLTRYLVFLHYKIQNSEDQNHKKNYVLVLKDAMNSEDFRKLRVELKISGLQKTGS